MCPVWRRVAIGSPPPCRCPPRRRSGPRAQVSVVERGPRDGHGAHAHAVSRAPRAGPARRAPSSGGPEQCGRPRRAAGRRRGARSAARSVRLGSRDLDLDRVAAELALELVGRARDHHLAAIHDRELRGEPVGLLHVVRGEQRTVMLSSRPSRSISCHMSARTSGSRPVVGSSRTEPAAGGSARARCRAGAPSRPRSRGRCDRRRRRPKALEQLADARLERGLAHAVKAAAETQVLARRGLAVGAGALPRHADRRGRPLGRHAHVARRARPESGRASVVRMRTAVDLPAPFGPSSSNAALLDGEGQSVEGLTSPGYFLMICRLDGSWRWPLRSFRCTIVLRLKSF